MFGAGGYEKQVAGTEAKTSRAIDKPSLAPDHDVHFVPSVGRLGIDTTGGVQLDGQRAVLVGDDERRVLRCSEFAKPCREIAVEAVALVCRPRTLVISSLGRMGRGPGRVASDPRRPWN
jgi:hypothetical protein